MEDIANAHARCNHHAKHAHIVRLSKYIRNIYSLLKQNYKQKNVEEMSVYYNHIQYIDRLLRVIYDILDKETIEEYEIYRDSVKQTVMGY